MAEDLTEKLLAEIVSGWAEELRKFTRGDPAAVPVVAKYVAAKKELDNYKKSKKK